MTATATAPMDLSDNVWRHRDADDGFHTVGYTPDGDLVVVDGRPFTGPQTIELATTLMMFAAGLETITKERN